MIFEKAASFRCHLKSVLCHEAVGCRGTPVCQRAHQVLHENRANPGRLAQKHTQLRRRPLQRQNARPRRHLRCAAGVPSPCAGPALLTRARSRCPLRMFPALRLLSSSWTHCPGGNRHLPVQCQRWLRPSSPASGACRPGAPGAATAVACRLSGPPQRSPSECGRGAAHDTMGGWWRRAWRRPALFFWFNFFNTPFALDTTHYTLGS